ncbi:LCP family protein [Candidatus Daviesbacteria bacterium]|nr:LCP family protein [Candidatus Daviesbacteria bacterium]
MEPISEIDPILGGKVNFIRLGESGAIPPDASRRRFLLGGGAAVAAGFASLLVPGLLRTPRVESNQHFPPTNIPSKGDQPPLPPTATAEPTKPPVKEVKLTNELLKPFVEQAYRKRAERERNDPEYSKRVDKELSDNTVNAVLWVYWEEHGESYANYGGSPTVISYDLKTGKIRSVSLSRDIRTPNLEKRQSDGRVQTMYMRHVYREGKFDQVREVVEEATGLAIDYQMVIKDTVIRDLLDKVGPLDVQVQKDHLTGPFKLGGQEYGPKLIKAGPQQMDTLTAMRFILAEDENPDGKQDERSYRKNVLVKALLKKLQSKVKENYFFVKELYDLMQTEIDQGMMQPDFDRNLLSVGMGNLGNLFTIGLSGLGLAKELLLNRSNVDTTIPEADPQKEIIIHDPYWGDGGVNRAHNIVNFQHVRGMQVESIRDEAQNGFLPQHMLIPDGGDPYTSDRVNKYWQSIRKLVKNKLLGRGEPSTTVTSSIQ